MCHSVLIESYGNLVVRKEVNLWVSLGFPHGIAICLLGDNIPFGCALDFFECSCVGSIAPHVYICYARHRLCQFDDDRAAAVIMCSFWYDNRCISIYITIDTRGIGCKI